MKTTRTLFLSLAGALCAFAAPAHAGGPTGVQPLPPLMGWVFDEGAGAVTIDEFSWLTGTLEGFSPAPWPAPGPFAYPGDHYLGFGGVSSRVVVHDDGVIAGRASSSVSIWFRAGTSLAPRQHILYSERDMCEFNIFWVGIDKRPGVPNGISFGVYDSTSPACGSGFWHVLTHPFIPIDGAWHHVVATLDSVAGMTLYYDGTPVASLSGIPPYRGGVQGSSTVGHGHTVGTPTYWTGSIDEVGLFDYALTPPEVMWLHANSLSTLPGQDHTPLCFGDGSGTACPCGNESTPGGEAGCRNSSNTAGKLVAGGSARLSFDTLSLTTVEMTPNTSCLIFQGTSSINGGLGSVFGDGLRCAGGSVIRLAIHAATDHYDWYPKSGEPPVSVQGLIPGPGTERYYQVWYRNAADFCASAYFNLTNAVRVTWGA